MVMDNLEVHPRGPQGSLIVGELIEQAGASVLFLPPYSLAHRRSVLQGQEHPA
jgi:transposase